MSQTHMNILSADDISFILSLPDVISNKAKIEAIKNTSEDALKQAYEAMFIFAGIWSVGGAVGGG